MIAYAALSPHPPFIIPEIGRDRLSSAQATIDGMEKLAMKVADANPETLVFLTPHGNVFSDAVSCLSEPQLSGSLSQFGSSLQWTNLPNDLPLVNEIALSCAANGINMVLVDRSNFSRHRLQPGLDHGILVPWYYIEKAGIKDSRIVALSVGDLLVSELYRLGMLIQQAADKLGRRVVIVASGDMSHHLSDDGPYSFHPDGPLFDQTIGELLRHIRVQDILELSPDLRKNAGECGYLSIIIMLGALDGYQVTSDIFSYEGPFGVGYLTAGFSLGVAIPSHYEIIQAKRRQEMENRRRQESLPVQWARMVAEQYVEQKNLPNLPDNMKKLLEQKAGVFVSIKKQGQLRGCIGTIMASYPNLADEIAHNAVSASTRDPRFLPIEKQELPELVYSVDILGEAEDCEVKDLDPVRYGVIVSSGAKRGLLLPDLAGVDTVEEQLRIALQKAGIGSREKYRIQRFEVTRYI